MNIAGYVSMFAPSGVDDDTKKACESKATAEEKQKIQKTSIDVTKALMLLGFDSWSKLEQGKYKKS